jgi:hypothetical protein
VTVTIVAADGRSQSEQIEIEAGSGLTASTRHQQPAASSAAASSQERVVSKAIFATSHFLRPFQGC